MGIPRAEGWVEASRGQHKEAGPESTGVCAAEGQGIHWVHITPEAMVDPQVPGAGVTKGQKPHLWTLGHVASIFPHTMLCSQSCHVTGWQGTFRPQPQATPDFLQEELFQLPYSCGYGPMMAMVCGFWVPMLVRRSYSAGQVSSCLLSLGSPLTPAWATEQAGLLHPSAGLFNSSIPCQLNTVSTSQASQTLTK